MENRGAVLRKMIDRVGVQDTPVLSLAAEALNIALGKVARQVFDCDAVLKDGEVAQVSLKSMLEAAPQPGLLVIVRAGGAKGILTLDGMLINGLVELMAGASDRAVYKQARDPTLIDIALCREFCDGILAEFPRKLAGSGAQAPMCDLVWQEPETEASRLTFVLENTPMARLSGTVELQGGLRGGGLSLSLPMHVWQGDGCKTPSVADPAWARDLRKNVLGAPIPLCANLEKIELPLARVMGLKAGDTLEISPYALSDLDLVSQTGKPLLKGRLGQENGKKAIAIDCICNAQDDLATKQQPAMAQPEEVQATDERPPPALDTGP